MSETQNARTFYRNIGGPHRLAGVRPVFRQGAWIHTHRVRRGDICDPGSNAVEAFGDKWERVHPDVAPPVEGEIDLTPYSRGSGWYEIHGQKVKGRDAALAMLMGETADGEDDGGRGPSDPVHKPD